MTLLGLRVTTDVVLGLIMLRSNMPLSIFYGNIDLLCDDNHRKK